MVGRREGQQAIALFVSWVARIWTSRYRIVKPRGAEICATV